MPYDPSLSPWLMAGGFGGDRALAAQTPVPQGPQAPQAPAFQGPYAPGVSPAAVKLAVKKAELAQKLKLRLASAAPRGMAPAAPAAPMDPLASQAQRIAQIQKNAQLPGQGTTVEDTGKSNFQFQDNRPHNMTLREINGDPQPDGTRGDINTMVQTGEFAEDTVDPNGVLHRKGTPMYRPTQQGAILPALNALKSGLPDYQALRARLGDSAALRGQMAPLASGGVDLSPLLNYMNYALKTDKFKAIKQPTAAELAQEYAKQAAEGDQEGAQLAGLENKLIDQVSLPRGQQFLSGQGGVQVIKVAPEKKIAGKGGPSQKEIDAYMKMTQGGSALLNNLAQQEGVLKTIPDNYNKSAGGALLNRLRYAGADIIGDSVLTPEQKKLDSVRSTMLQQVNSGLGLHRWTQSEIDSLSKRLGMGSTATKEKVFDGLNYIRSFEQQAYLDAEAAHPEGAAVVQGRGRPSSKDFAPKTPDAIMQGPTAAGGKSYDGSTPLDASATPEMKATRIQYLKQKAGGK